MSLSKVTVTLRSALLPLLINLLVLGVVALWPLARWQLLIVLCLLAFVWLLTVWRLVQVKQSSDGKSLASLQIHPGDNVSLAGFLIRLLKSVDREAVSLQNLLARTHSQLVRMEASMLKANELAEATGLSAANASYCASTCGEVGRGFVSVSSDLLKITGDSSKDLSRLVLLLGAANALLQDTDFADTKANSLWRNGQLNQALVAQSLTQAEQVLQHLTQQQQQLSRMRLRYGSASQLEVRRLQLAEAIKQVIDELSHLLMQASICIEGFAKELRLLKMVDKISAVQYMEIKKAFS